MITFEVLSATRGHTTMYIEEVSPEERGKLAKTVQSLLQEGHTIFLMQGDETYRIQGYNPQTNEWVVHTTPHKRKGETRAKTTTRRRASGTKATTVPKTAGG